MRLDCPHQDSIGATRPACRRRLGAPTFAVMLTVAWAGLGCGGAPPSRLRSGIDASAARPNTEQNVAPTINERFKNPELDVEMWADRFSGESREVFTARFEVLEALGLRSGQRVADVGAGTGLYVKLFAQAVGAEGRVYAIDIAQKFLDFVDENAKADGLTQVTTLLGADRTTHLPTQSVDVVFHSDTYHHFEYPMTMSRDLARALVDGGDMFVLDFEKVPGQSSDFVMGHVRAGKETVIEEIESSGFKLVREIDVVGLDENYLLHFRKVSP